MLNVFGGKGFIGSAYVNKFSDCVINERNDYEVKTDNILYFISTIHNYHVFDNPYIDINTNLIVLIDVLKQLKDRENVVFNFISSCTVYGEVDLPATEESQCNPKGFYSITKRTAEQLLIFYCKTFNINYRILRLGNVIGGFDSKASKNKNVLSYLIGELKENNDITLHENGELVRDYIDLDDCVDAINLVITDGELNSIYNIANGEPTKLKDLILYAKNKLNSTSKILGILPPEYHQLIQVKSVHMDNEKLKQLGYNRKYSAYDVVDKLI